MSTLASSELAPSLRQRVAGAALPAASLVALLAIWSAWRLADDVTQSVGVAQTAGRLITHVLVALVPLMLLLVVAVRPPATLVRLYGYRPTAVATAVLSVVWVPLAIFLTYYFGS